MAKLRYCIFQKWKILPEFLIYGSVINTIHDVQ